MLFLGGRSIYGFDVYEEQKRGVYKKIFFKKSGGWVVVTKSNS